MIHNEDSRVKIPGLLHFLRLGYTYQSKKDANIDPNNNIFIDVFRESLNRINNIKISDKRIELLINELSDLTNNKKDKGKAFYNRLLMTAGIKLIDVNNVANNDFRVVAELKYEKDRATFRPDITILVNGIPLGFIEVKKPNNREGIQAEFQRALDRANKGEFVQYLNQMQVLGFSNNQEYDDSERVKMSGSFYTTPNGTSLTFNHFREEKKIGVNEYLSDEIINFVLADNNISKIKETSEFIANLNPDTPGNRFITSVFSTERLLWILRYGLVYVDSVRDGLNKHIIRYPQFFALDAILEKLKDGMQRGIVWHTQGSGKTALAYFASNILRDYYARKNIITKFYFVVDRLDLLIQASGEFSSRGMSIASINSKEDFVNNIKSPVIVSSVGNNEYKETMNVVNIQKFSQEAAVDSSIDKKIQRIYFLDEVHRGYKPKGTFLSNLLGVDTNGIFIGLTGTPILKKEFKSTDIFSGYIHKYYYNKSIADGYTLKIKKENISTKLRNEVRGMFKLEENQKISSKHWELVGKQSPFVNKICGYIEEDFEVFSKEIYRDNSLGFMIVTSSSEQARMIQEWFKGYSNLKTALVLYDEEYNKDKQEDFRGKRQAENSSIITSNYYGVIVYNMLLTGFDAPRLKRLYLLRRIKEHSLLQTLARVNRPYKKMRYGYIVDFVDITEEYEETNKRYLEELRDDIIDEDGAADVNDMFVDVVEVKKQIKSLQNKLFIYMGNIESNLEDFRLQIETLEEEQLSEIRAYLNSYKECYNELRMAKEDVSTMPIESVGAAYREVSNRLQFKRDEERLLNDDNEFDDIDFSNLIVEFLKNGEVDLDFTTENDVLEIVANIENEFYANTDKIDLTYIQRKQEFRDIMIKIKRDGNNTEKIINFIKALHILHNQLRSLNISNKALASTYRGDETCMRLHKRLLEVYGEHIDNPIAYEIITEIILAIDDLLGGINPSMEIMTQELMRPVRDSFRNKGINLGKSQVLDIIKLITDDKYN
ncbi:type I restriction endonuclease subunit R [Planococcus sp. CPCC 101016]|uniref:type I restriction endonuclease n=1 Tax=Planococcus sp. CPCC 101016 TaxID=2599617 RepID=UPI0011B6AB2C|nr:type I restriction endonuclease [Planococcus sp. CPCC 101016]TWT08200.1 type I restriction endonuclease subunit R [Planococcus sp. CPCC 101016]